jgi:NADH:ubiquinone reductase (H+-translocating)
VIVGGGFAGVACAQVLADAGVDVTLIDRNDHHQFQPLLYQVATAQLAPTDVRRPLRAMFRKDKTVAVKQCEIVAIDPLTRTVTGTRGESFTGDHLVLAMGSQPNFFGVPGAADNTFPLYSAADAQRLRDRILTAFEDADLDPSRIDQGALTFVVVGAGPTGVEVAGALADLVLDIMPERYHDLDVGRSRIVLVDHGHVVLGAFSDRAHAYAAKVLAQKGVHLRLGTGVEEVRPDGVVLDDGSEIASRCVVWAGGLKSTALSDSTDLRRGRGGRVGVDRDLRVDGYEGVYVVGDAANIPGRDGETLPQLGSVALQAGTAAGHSILAAIKGKPPPAFHYHDKGIMAMIGQGAAVAEMGPHRHELHGHIAFSAWLGVHAWLLSGTRARLDAFMSWAWDSFSHSRSPSTVLDPDAARIDWGDDADPSEPDPTTDTPVEDP